MRAEIYWINKNLAIMPRPRGGDWLEDEIESLKNFGISVIVSLLETDEIIELGLEDEAQLCESQGLRFLSFPIEDRNVPKSLQEVETFVRKLFDLLKNGEKISIHCRQGVGRSSLIAACILVSQGISSDKVFDEISKARKCNVPDTIEQKQWLIEFTNKLKA